MTYDEGDYLNSDDLENVYELSKLEYENIHPQAMEETRPSGMQHRQGLEEQLAMLDAEIKKYDDEIEELKALRDVRMADRRTLLSELQEARMAAHGKGKGKMLQSGIDYNQDSFDWDNMVRKRMKDIFRINSFRLCQQGVINANMDGRDVICVMPTGGGKSLTYQLPATIASGLTLVISPLVALILDQVLHLQEVGVEAVKLTGSTPQGETNDIKRRLLATAAGDQTQGKKDIKLCYVTPEKIAKNKDFRSLLQKLANAGKLARIVIDEAHCVSQLGHDFRPDYQKLRVLRQEMPNVPIMALSATCPPKVLDDLIKVLGLRTVVDGKCADVQGTVYFSAPLYRKNLHYTVLPKHNESNKVMQAMTDYILEHHKDETGIIYCLSKKDTEKVAEEIYSRSKGNIKTGVYHADRKDSEKEDLHKKWRAGSVKVVCATIAFGLGIDKGDVRFVLHHSLSKSLDGFYQESGRAGRDGKDSDCVLFYRPQDAATLSGMMYGEKDGSQKLHAMLKFAQEPKECRKLLFAKYFSHSSQLSISSWGTDESDALEPCEHCDNCTRDPDTLETKDVTVQVWQLLKITDEVQRSGGNLTITMLAGLARGGSGGSYDVNKGKRKGKEKVTLDLDNICGGKVDLKKDDIETLLVRLTIDKYLAESYHPTAYSTLVYIKLGPMAPRLTRVTKERAENDSTLRIVHMFRKEAGKAKKTKDKTVASEGKRKSSASAAARPMKRRKKDLSGNGYDEDVDDSGDIAMHGFSAVPGPSTAASSSASTIRREPIEIDDDDFSEGGDDEDEEEDEIEDADWMSNLRGTISRTTKTSTTRTSAKRSPSIVELSSD